MVKLPVGHRSVISQIRREKNSCRGRCWNRAVGGAGRGRVKVSEEIAWKANDVVNTLTEPDKGRRGCRSLATSRALRSHGAAGQHPTSERFR